MDRHQFRAKWHDYNGGIYFVTICSHNKTHIFGSITGNTFVPTQIGAIITEHIERISTYYTDVELHNSVVMPNHIHIVIAVGTRFIASASESENTPNLNYPESPNAKQPNLGCLKSSKHGDECADFHHNSRLASIIGAFKAGVTRAVRTRKFASLPIWQPRFHEHIIRDQRAYDNIMYYVDTNVANWTKDCFAK